MQLQEENEEYRKDNNNKYISIMTTIKTNIKKINK